MCFVSVNFGCGARAVSTEIRVYCLWFSYMGPVLVMVCFRSLLKNAGRRQKGVISVTWCFIDCFQLLILFMCSCEFVTKLCGFLASGTGGVPVFEGR